MANSPCRSVLPALALFFAVASPPAQAPLPADFDAYVGKVQQAFEIPGLCIAVVARGQTVLAKGYGVRRLGEAAPVDATTGFGIASNTKVFTAAALGLLVEQGKVAWGDPVQRHVPSFQLSDAYITRELTILDLLVHRSGLGLGAGDLLWWPGTRYDRKEVVRRLRNVPIATSFRSTYAYDNVLYLVAGEVIEAASGQTWERFVDERILQRVGMSHSHVQASAAMAGGEVSGTHARVLGTVQAVAADTSDTTNPAGGIVSNAEDMAKWLTVLLGRGALPDGARLFSERTWQKLTTLVVPMPIRDPHPVLGELRPNFLGYALGLSVSDYRGKKLITHTGGLPGFVSRVLWVPDLQFGIAVLTNQESLHGIDAIVWRVLDEQFGKADKGGADKDWFALHLQAERKAIADVDAGVAKATAARRPDSKPSLPLAGYVGRYEDAWYGAVTVAQADGELRIAFDATPLLRGRLEHWQHDTFVARWDDRGLRADAFVTFALTPDGAIDQVKVAPFDDGVDFSFDYEDLLLKPVATKKKT